MKEVGSVLDLKGLVRFGENEKIGIVSSLKSDDWREIAWSLIPAIHLPNCVTSGKLLALFIPQFP